MKTVLLILLALSIVFSSCEKEEETLINNNTSVSLSCKIDGSNFGNAIINTTNSSGNVSIIADDGTYNIALKVLSINSRSSGDVILFSSPSLAIITIGSTTYSNTYFDPTKGEIIITNLDLNSGEVSGTFFFEAQDVTPNEFGTVNVTAGEFSNILF